MRRVSNMGACRRSDDDGSPIHAGANGDTAKAPEHLPGNDVGGAVGVPMHEPHHSRSSAARALVVRKDDDGRRRSRCGWSAPHP